MSLDNLWTLTPIIMSIKVRSVSLQVLVNDIRDIFANAHLFMLLRHRVMSVIIRGHEQWSLLRFNVLNALTTILYNTALLTTVNVVNSQYKFCWNLFYSCLHYRQDVLLTWGQLIEDYRYNVGRDDWFSSMNQDHLSFVMGTLNLKDISADSPLFFKPPHFRIQRGFKLELDEKQGVVECHN